MVTRATTETALSERHEPRPRPFGRALARAVLSLVVPAWLLVGAISLVGWLNSGDWPWELTSHFRLQYFEALLVCTLALLGLRRFYQASGAALFAAANLATILPHYTDQRPSPLPASALRIVSLNVHWNNPQHESVRDFLLKSRADLILLIELAPPWQPLLEDLATRWPHRCIELHGPNGGIALLSRLPLGSAEIRRIGPLNLPTVVARLNVAGQPLTLIGTHPPSPLLRENHALRDVQLAVLADMARSETGPLVLCGDLNITHWSPGFLPLIDGTRLRDSRQGFGLQTSWPAWLPAALRIPIDHFLVSPEVTVVSRVVGPYVGSDHLPIVIEMAMRTPQASAECSD